MMKQYIVKMGSNIIYIKKKKLSSIIGLRKFRYYPDLGGYVPTLFVVYVF